MPTNEQNSIKVDTCGDCIRVDNISGVVWVSGIPVFRIRLESSGKIFLQFTDRNKYRAVGRGAKYIEVPMEAIIEKIKASCI